MTKQLISGIYRLYDAHGDSFVGFSRNVDGTRKRLMFELKLNACSYKPWQDFYNKAGGLTFELLEEYTPNGVEDDIVLDAQLHARMYKWCERLGERTVRIQQSE